MQIVVPATAFMPTEAELKEIITHGPYTEPLSNVYPLLQMSRVRTVSPASTAALSPPSPAADLVASIHCALQVKETLRFWTSTFREFSIL